MTLCLGVSVSACRLLSVCDSFFASEALMLPSKRKRVFTSPPGALLAHPVLIKFQFRI